MSLSSEVLPLPLRPSRTMVSPLATVSVISETISREFRPSGRKDTF